LSFSFQVTDTDGKAEAFLLSLSQVHEVVGREYNRVISTIQNYV